jgi:hypothetical protein
MKKTSFILTAAFAGVLSFMVGASGCDELEASFDCDTVCERYRDCFNSAYDVGTCQSRCEAQADNNDPYQAAVDACEDCIGVNSCLSTTFNCPSCNLIVP